MKRPLFSRSSVSTKRKNIAVTFALIVFLGFFLITFLSPFHKQDQLAVNNMAIHFYSVWAMPHVDSQFFKQSKLAIDSLSREFNVKPFLPHVTVLGAFPAKDDNDAIEKTKTYCNNLKPYHVNILDLSSGNKYFQCVYLRAVQSEQVMNSSKLLRSAVQFNLDGISEYMPHLSLVYGNLTEAEKLKAVQIVKQDYPDLLRDAFFPVEQLSLYRTDPNDLLMTTWEKLGDFELKG